jgi:hypothetical protein
MDVTEVYAQQGSLLHFSWGIGNQLHVCGVGTPGHGESQPIVSTVEWYTGLDPSDLLLDHTEHWPLQGNAVSGPRAGHHGSYNCIP